LWKKQNQKYLPDETEIRFLDYDQMSQEVYDISKKLEKIGINGSFDTFQSLRSPGFRSDLWRWMTLWQNGGIYLDATLGFDESLATDWIDFD
jgi:mannosyltransferase OCH1-like enzyme